MAAQAEATGKAFVDLGENFKFSENSYEDFADAYNKSRSQQKGKDGDWLSQDLENAGALGNFRENEHGELVSQSIDIDKAKSFLMS
jgi:hypothetical protein